jgi:hypothetical protein
MDTKSYGINLEELFVHATFGKKVDLRVAPVPEIVRVERDGRYIKTIILSVEYSGSIDDKPFTFNKYYSMTDDVPDNALRRILMANKRLKNDFEKLKEAGIEMNDRIAA